MDRGFFYGKFDWFAGYNGRLRGHSCASMCVRKCVVKSQAADREIDDFMTVPRSRPG